MMDQAKREKSVQGVRRGLGRGLVLVLVAAAMSLGAVACGAGPSGRVESGAEGSTRPRVDPKALEWFAEGIRVSPSDPSRAKKLFQDAVGEDKDFGEAWYNLALLQEQTGDSDAAVESYEQAIRTRPELADAYVNLGVIHLERYEALARAKEMDKALAERNKAKELFLKVVDDESGLDGFHVQANLNLGMIYRLEGEEVVRRDNDGADLTVRMEEGQATQRNYEVSDAAKERFADAVRHVRKALAGDSNNITSYENLAAIYYDLNSLEVATLVSQQAIQKQLDRNGELAADLSAGKITQAEYDAHLITDAQMASVHNTFGLIWLARGEVALAYDSFRKAVERDPGLTEALFNVAGVAVNVQDYQTAYDTYTKILQIQPDNREARLSMAVAARGLGNLQEAEQTYNAMLQSDPDYAPAKFNLGILYQEYHRDLAKAKEIYQEFAAMPGAQKWAPDRIKDAQARVTQIDEIWAAQKKAEEEQKAMEEELRKMKELEEQQMREQGGDSGEGDAAAE